MGRLLAHLAHSPGTCSRWRAAAPPTGRRCRSRSTTPPRSSAAVPTSCFAHWRQTDEPADWQIAEVAVHTWDLATATGQPVDRLDPEVAERGLAFMSAVLKPEMRGEVFAPERQAPDGASAYERIAAFAGRDVG